MARNMRLDDQDRAALRVLDDAFTISTARASLLAEIADLPPSAFIPTAHAAAYLGSTPGVLQSWRSQRRGPRFHGSNEFVRYRISDLDLWMAARAGEIPGNLEASKASVNA